MRVVLIAVGTRMPEWVVAGYHDYAKRLTRECTLRLLEVAPSKRAKGSIIERAVGEEGKRILAAMPKKCLKIALDEHGRTWDTAGLAKEMRDWWQDGVDVALMVGGADGLSKDCRAAADYTWSLSALTLPHPLVRVIVAEQLYRAWSVVTSHPYHRA